MNCIFCGLFCYAYIIDIHGRQFYKCPSSRHEKVFLSGFKEEYIGTVNYISSGERQSILIKSS